jgi:hypothetical protein
MKHAMRYMFADLVSQGPMASLRPRVGPQEDRGTRGPATQPAETHVSGPTLLAIIRGYRQPESAGNRQRIDRGMIHARRIEHLHRHRIQSGGPFFHGQA